MSGVNKVIIIGRLGQDPELRYTTSGQAVARFSIATSESWKDKNNGEKQERTEWHRIVVWGRLAELCRDYLAKGRQAYIDGRLQTNSWEDSNGVKKYTTEIIANNIQFLGETAGKMKDTNSTSDGVEFVNPTNTGDNKTNDVSSPSITDDDIPF